MTRQLEAAVLVLAITAPCAFGQVADRERIINVDELREAMTKAAEPMARRIRSTTLDERFLSVAEALAQDDVDEERLLEALALLKQEISTFTQGWSELEDPLWKGQEQIGKTIDRVRMMLARGAGKQPSAESEALLANYDRRLSHLAREIRAESDPLRQQRLKSLFSNTLALRKLVEVYSRIDLRPASQVMLAQLVRALMRLEDQLTAATFQIERARIVLDQTGEFVGAYIAILEDLVEAEALAHMLADMQSTGLGIGAVVTNLAGLSKDVDQFTVLMESFMTRIGAKIEAEAGEIAGNFEDAPGLAGVDLEAEIDRYYAAFERRGKPNPLAQPRP